MREGLRRTQALLLALVDAAMVAAAMALAWLVRWDLNACLAAAGLWHPFTVGVTPTQPYFLAACAAVPLCLLVFREFGLYRESGAEAATAWGGGEIFRVAAAALAASVALAAAGFFVKEQFLFSRAYTLLFFPCCALTVAAGRWAYRAARRALWARGVGQYRLLLVGRGRLAEELARALAAGGGQVVLGTLTLKGADAEAPAFAPGSVYPLAELGRAEDLAEVVARTGVDEVIVAQPEADRAALQAIAEDCFRAHARFRLVPGVYEMLLDRMDLELAGGIPLLGFRGSRIEGVNLACKRLFDVLVAGALLVLLAPLLAVLAVAVYLSGGRPVFFCQERIGFRGRPFRFWKFRSMRPGAEREAGAHEAYTKDLIAGRATPEEFAPGDARFKLAADPRVTPLGRFLRRYSLDELPQLWNVLKGEMSLIGPRPPVPYEVKHYRPRHLRRFEVRPGISGLWQVSGRNRLTFEEMVKLDLYYMENWSLELDLRILFRTLGVVLFQRAA